MALPLSLDLAFDPNQPRDRAGRWSKTLGGAKRVAAKATLDSSVPEWARGYEKEHPIADLPEGWAQVDPFTALAPDTVMSATERGARLRAAVAKIRPSGGDPEHPLFFKDDRGNTVVVDSGTTEDPDEVKFVLKSARAAYNAADFPGSAIGDKPVVFHLVTKTQMQADGGSEGIVAYVVGQSTDEVRVGPLFWGTDSSKPGNDLYSQGGMERFGEDGYFADSALLNNYLQYEDGDGPNGEPETVAGLGKYLLTHELGHINDNRRNDTVDPKGIINDLPTPQAMDIYSEAGTKISGYAKTSPWEAYAEAFAAWIKGSRGRAVLKYAEAYGWKEATT